MRLVLSLRNITHSRRHRLTSPGCIPLSRYEHHFAGEAVCLADYPDLLVPGRRCPDSAMQVLY
jgi:hypothetical protein